MYLPCIQYTWENWIVVVPHFHRLLIICKSDKLRVEIVTVLLPIQESYFPIRNALQSGYYMYWHRKFKL